MYIDGGNWEIYVKILFSNYKFYIYKIKININVIILFFLLVNTMCNLIYIYFCWLN